jgi:hypothetical protein
LPRKHLAQASLEEDWMKLSTLLSSRLTSLSLAAGVGICTIGIAMSQGCSSSTSGGGTTGTVGGPPAKPTAGATTSKDEHNFALHVLFLGDTDRNGTASGTAWKAIGYNLDGKVTTKDSTDVCSLASGASKTTQVDGNTGIDNSFGENILPIILTTAGSDASKKINDSIAKGSFTVMVDSVGLSSDPKQTATGLSGALYAGGTFDQADSGAKPTFTTADNWPVRPELLVGGDIKSPKVKFGDAYVVDGKFVNGSPGELTLNLAIGGVALDLAIHSAVITFDHAAATKAINGTIAGVINTEELITGLKTVAGRISTSLCTGSAFESIAQQIRQASDIMSDGSNASGKACNGISIGLGFTADEIGKPSAIAPLATPTVDPCTTAGDAGTTGDAATTD